MAGIRNLDALLAGLEPRLIAGRFIFCNLPGGRYGEAADCQPIASFMEGEGLSLVIPQEQADAAGLPYEGVFRWITLSVHSDLQAMGLTAAVATALTTEGISANVIAACHHDHLFVPDDRADEALVVL